MEALWNLEDRYKVSTRGALLIFVCTAFLVVGLCTTSAAVLKKKARRKQLVHHDLGDVDDDDEEEDSTCSSTKWPDQPSCCNAPIKRVLMGTVRWSGANRWEEEGSFGSGGGGGGRREKTPPLLGLEQFGVDAGWHSHNSSSPVWQRPILMGEKCELPRFSGLILYDEKGQLLPYNHKENSYQEATKQETAAAVRTTLKDLL